MMQFFRNKQCELIRLVVHKQTFVGTNRSNNVVFPIRGVTVELHSGSPNRILFSIYLSGLNHETSTHFKALDKKTKVQIFFEQDNVTTTLPDEMSGYFVNFLKHYRPKGKQNYCCINFAYEMLYGRGVIKNDNAIDDFNVSPSDLFSEEKLNCGDIVYLHNDNDSNKNVHYAIYIGQNEYLSLFGTTGPLMITSLDAMKKGFGADICSNISKKQRSNAHEPIKNVINLYRNELIKSVFFATTIAAAGLFYSSSLRPNS